MGHHTAPASRHGTGSEHTDPAGHAAPHPAPLKERLQRHWRARRLRAFADRLGARPGDRILDLGGNIETWTLAEQPYRLTLLNTSAASAGTLRPWRLPTNGAEWRVIVGDATDLGQFADQSFDIVFSNSVIEHLGDAERVACFAREVRRVGRSYWVQTPAYTFPIEAHTGLPFYWFYPRPLRNAWAAWQDRRHAHQPWHCPLAQTSHLKLSLLRQLFPEAQVYTERVGGFAKSWSMYRRGSRP
ncbi:class I SAM-dependent methyltransferase [Ideonella sp.]|uniref:class I SAM-dependent methyltransferase n=1 Tax=Ideonella sp. TaxID=1929293 RepID=UPI0035AFE2A7